MRLHALAASALLAVVVGFTSSAQQLPAPDDSVFQAIRRNDLASLKDALSKRGPGAQDASGLTPLVLAAAFGTRESVSELLSLGADVNAPATGGITPLHVAWRDPAIARTLLEKGAKVDTRTQLDATPLLLASSANGTADVVALLLARGADSNAADSRGITPLIAAASVGNTATAMLLLAHGAVPDAYAPGIGQKNATPLMGAAMNGDLALARVLLRSKPDVNRQGPDNDGTVKNGKVTLGSFTALHLAVASRNPEMVKLLLGAGARIDTPDVRGFTPLVWAVASDHPNPAVVRMLLQAGANPRASAKSGETPAEWARRYNAPGVLSLLNLKPTPASVLVAAPSHPVMDARGGAERALPLLRNASARMMTDGGCVACHAQPLAVMATALASVRGWAPGVEQSALAQVQQQVNSGLSGSLQGRETGGQPDSTAFSILALSIAKVPPSPATDAFTFYLAAKQRDAGNWHALTGRAPMQDGDITRTALAIKVLSVYGAPAQEQDFKARVAKATRWLDAQQPMTTEERVMQLLGLSWGKTDSRKLRDRQRQLLNLQRADGGWAQTRDFSSDAYATGQVLYALRELAVPSSEGPVRRGVEFLLRSQAGDGSWQVTSRALKIQPYFESGFPYGHDQWISQAGSSWAVIGLASASGDALIARR